MCDDTERCLDRWREAERERERERERETEAERERERRCGSLRVRNASDSRCRPAPRLVNTREKRERERGGHATSRTAEGEWVAGLVCVGRGRRGGRREVNVSVSAARRRLTEAGTLRADVVGAEGVVAPGGGAITNLMASDDCGVVLELPPRWEGRRAQVGVSAGVT